MCAGVIMTTMLMLLSAEITLRPLCWLYFYSSSRKVKNRQGCLSASAIIGHVRGGGWGRGWGGRWIARSRRSPHGKLVFRKVVITRGRKYRLCQTDCTAAIVKVWAHS